MLSQEVLGQGDKEGHGQGVVSSPVNRAKSTRVVIAKRALIIKYENRDHAFYTPLLQGRVEMSHSFRGAL